MTQQKTSDVRAVSHNTSEPRVTRHDVTFQLKVLAFNGQAPSDEAPLYKALSTADEDLYDRLPREIEGWRFRDHYEIECNRLEVCQPEFGSDEELPDDSRLYNVTLTASHALPVLAAQATAERPISVEQLLAQVPAVLRDIYAQAGVELALHKVTFYQVLEQSAQGEYLIG